MPVNPRFNFISSLTCCFRRILVDTMHDLEAVTLYRSESKFYIYREIFHDDNPNVKWMLPSHATIEIEEYSLDQEDAAFADYVTASRFNKVKCHECGKWIPFSEAHRYAPEGISCSKPECVKKMTDDETWFLSHLD